MSRMERNKEKREKKIKARVFARIIFIFTMILTTSICLLVVDVSANKMLGNETIIQKSIASLKKYK